MAISLFLFWQSPFTVFGQSLELGLLLGGSNYHGDLASTELKVIPKQTDFAYGGFLRYHLNESFAIRLQILQTELKADDANSSFTTLIQRNLRFFSPLTDASLRFEWYPFAASSQYQQTFLPYFALGASFFKFNPQALYNGRFFELRPLRTEGQGLPSFPERTIYQLYSGSVLSSIGFKILVNDDITIGIDFSAHYTFTDYLDDVSTTYADYNELAQFVSVQAADIAFQVDDFFGVEQTSPLPGTNRGNPNVNDWFLIGGITLSYKLINRDRGQRKGIGCPTF